MSLIIDEQNLAKKYLFEVDGGCVVLSPENVAKAEAMILNDSDYNRSRNVNDSSENDVFNNSAVEYWLKDSHKPIKSNKKSKGSTAYWMVQLKEALSKEIEESKLKAIILLTVSAVDRDNVTHISSDGEGPRVLTERIFMRKKTLIDELRNRSFDLVKNLAAKTFDNPKELSGKIYHPRENYSFATKFCHYACFYFFKGLKEQDNYSIYDEVVSRALPLYLRKFGITKSNGTAYEERDFNSAGKYKTYSSLIDQLRGDKISRNGFDHLLWYYHKSRS